MKKIIVVAIILAVLAIGYKAVGAYSMYKTEANESYVKITNVLIDMDSVVNYKFTDKVGSSTVTCYGSYSKLGAANRTVAISCIK